MYFILIAFIFVLLMVIAQMIRNRDKALKSWSVERQALDEGLQEICENYEMDALTMREHIVDLEEIRGNLTKQVELREGQIQDQKTIVHNLHEDNHAKTYLIKNLNTQRDVANRKILELGRRATDLDEIVQFHANNCLPHIEHIRANKFPTASTGG